MKKSRLMELANVAVTEGGGDTSWIKDPQVRSKVDIVIKTLGSLTGPGETVDGETMQFILEAIGMDEQMLKQLKNSSVSFSDVRESLRIMDEQPNRLHNAIEEAMFNIDPDMSYKHFAEAVALMLEDGYGQHNYKPFVDHLRKLLNT